MSAYEYNRRLAQRDICFLGIQYLTKKKQTRTNSVWYTEGRLQQLRQRVLYYAQKHKQSNYGLKYCHLLQK